MPNELADLNAKYCRERAEEARTKGEVMVDLEARMTMLKVAELWTTMADRAERRASGS